MKYVVVLKEGPVQGYIAQSRRTRDLWYGSHLLSNLARTMAVSLTESGATLVFPHPEQAKDTSTGVANKLVALVEDAPEQAARNARRAAKERLLEDWRRVFKTCEKTCESMLIPEASALAEEQLDTFLEIHAAWAPIADTPMGYADALLEAERALEARRGLREFVPWKQPPPAGTHKSSLDGARPSLLRRERHVGHLWRDFRIGLREELDALGVLKRVGGNPGQFVPVPSIGMAAWLQTAATRHPALLAALKAECARRGFQTVSVRNRPWVEAFPYDGQLVLPERVAPYFEEYAVPDARQAAARFVHEFVEPLRDAVRAEPFPYVACLVADGDRMGRALEALARQSDGHAAHQRISRALADFTRQAKTIVEVEHRGVLVYAGGDDVLAFVTPMDALACAQALAAAFRATLEAALTGTHAEVPTLSVGLGIGHVLESLGELLELGRRAERAAKDAGRDALAVLMAKHAGRERLWTAPWATDPVERLTRDMALLSRDTQPLPLTKVHEVAALARRFPSGTTSAPELAELLSDEASRILARAEAGRSPVKLTPEAVGLELPTSPNSLEPPHASLDRWASRLLVADVLARASGKLIPASDKAGVR
ncbi:type III-B CRISPR-associated protein Cas10/Cmr2 [Myxococcus sp. MxC21-1]|uniref:type III-B CRISPR-associated protein Cas10/Cmr2 n=1 Tax=Myxococcus sp. MxC21-1 TaxID=3041439 RepID=UPI00292FAB3F|nr:type III-B CRISPR-associated protein Cas10/Cmr2 [Myxococcus sp. MxC21-1]WNZ62077.1 type III-B CRISPR-associated protein Cas10/Cmr2 [Myxococcus sp. MxC21-1]